ncbi:MAG: long-chain fatty acid--CoA ligase [Burkholderiales bacterium]|nr:long-chain fatty acid--CoA ligase [Burkholderiales bacterium]
MNIAQHVERIARQDPGRKAIIFEGKHISYGALETCAGALARSLRANGVQRGDRVALYLPNIPAFMLSYLAGLKVGAIVVSVNSIFKSEEVKYLLNDSGAKVVFTTAELLPNVPREECPSLEKTVLCEGVSADEILLGDWLSSGKPALKTEDMAADDPALLLYSSGTTGFPKGVTLTHNNVITNTRAAVNCSRHSRTDRLAIFLPLFHVFAQNYIMNAGFVAGATLILFRRFVPDVVLDEIERQRVTMFFAVPTIYIGLLGANVPKQKLASIRYYFSAAATMPQEISRRWTETYGPAVHEGYGLTECSPCAAYNHVSKHKFGSVGTAIEDFEVKIFDENDRELPRGEWGEIVMRGPGVMKEYWGKPEDTAQALRGGWLHSGDIGRMDEEGYIFIVDRVKDMINVSGFKVWPAEIEHYLYQIPEIKEVAVYGVPDALKGESVCAAVVLKDGAQLSPESVIEWCKEKLAAYKTPARVDIVKELPKSATGKILKRMLRQQN